MNETVVVGVDGSPAARSVLEYAIEEAARRGAQLRVVAAVALPEFWTSYYGELVPPPPNDLLGEARRQTQRFVDEVVAAHGDAARGVPIKVEIRAGRPGEILVDAAEGAALLVVGHRGLGSVGSVLLGSVGLHCVLHASCPVTVVRPKAVRAADPVRAAPSAAGPVWAAPLIAPA
jgi:nucleotide-binding universal stress UspA family protein